MSKQLVAAICVGGAIAALGSLAVVSHFARASPNGRKVIPVQVGSAKYEIPAAYFTRPRDTPPERRWLIADAILLVGTQPGFEPGSAAIRSRNPFNGQVRILVTPLEQSPVSVIKRIKAAYISRADSAKHDADKDALALYRGQDVEWFLYSDVDGFTLCRAERPRRYAYCKSIYPQDGNLAQLTFSADLASVRRVIRSEVTSKFNSWIRYW